MSGGKGGSQTTEVKIPKWLEGAARSNIARGQYASQIGPIPYYGPDFAAFTPMQNAAFQNTADAMGAFGMAAPSGGAVDGMPQPDRFAGGVRGYSSGSLYDQALNELRQANPGQFKAINSMFINPNTGQGPKRKF